MQHRLMNVRHSGAGDPMETHDRMKLAAHQPLKGGNLLVLGLWMRSAIAGAAFAAAVGRACARVVVTLLRRPVASAVQPVAA
jgi:hypothetical protein